ncbi:hypothetical protein EPN28_02790 [Patescibacteria group bacterium]|nr:MAG: hypothetical protein EPN28_02790 [Patescibacteria group bacterium]
MKAEKVKEIVMYWRKTAEHDYETMLGLFRIKRYSDALFYFDKATVKLLNTFNDFNIRCRYPEYKLAFYKRCTRGYAGRQLKEMKKIYHGLEK